MPPDVRPAVSEGLLPVHGSGVVPVLVPPLVLTPVSQPPVQLDRAITFAPSGAVVIAALSSLRKGGILAINAIHLDQMPSFDYDSLLWGERQIRSVANMTRQDARDYLDCAGKLGIKPQVQIFSLDQANEALQAVKNETANGPCVILP